MHVEIGEILISGTGKAIARKNAGETLVFVGSIEKTGAGTGTALSVVGGAIKGFVNKIDTTAAYSISAGAELDIMVNSLSGTDTNSGTINKISGVNQLIQGSVGVGLDTVSQIKAKYHIKNNGDQLMLEDSAGAVNEKMLAIKNQAGNYEIVIGNDDILT